MRVRRMGLPLIIHIVVIGASLLPFCSTAAADGDRSGGEGEHLGVLTATSKADDSGRERSNRVSAGAGVDAVAEKAAPESTLHAIDKPFLQKQGEWGERGGHGISFDLTGEPESGTTWISRVIVELALQLCGSPTNSWCEMGGLVIVPTRPDPWYAFEMIDKDKQELFVHFDGAAKHQIPGFVVDNDCNPHGKPHPNKFANFGPCVTGAGESVVARAREELISCLPEISLSSGCSQKMPPRDPSIRRMAVLFRDPRDAVISEHRVRKEVYRQTRIPPLELFIHRRFETIVAWIHQRWMWHNTFLREASHVMFYEDLEADPLALVPLSEFMGLKCSPGQARAVWREHRHSSLPGGFAAYGLPTATVAWMNETMQSLLPEPTLARWGLFSSR